jgi:hypothetical protein
VISSSDKSREGDGLRQDWLVDNYFEMGAREVYLMGTMVRQYHRTIEALYSGLQKAGFRVENLRESQPQPERFEDEALYQRRLRIPLYLFFMARKV